ncbi:MAG: SLC13 family permease, partial [Phycisphaerales bacterium]|nr:SLC13 family permease [Phycisphaerales bacterium]
MPYEAWYTLFIIALLTVALLSNRVGPDTAMLGALTMLIVGGVFGSDIQAAVAGFADPSVLMIAALFVVATGLNQTGAMELIAQRVLGRPKTLRGAQIRMMLPVCLMSSFMNNTPIVAMYLPIVHSWARKLKLSPSHLFMPLSFAAIIGGACTLIGTSTNIAVNQLYLDYFDANQATLLAEHGLARPSTSKQFWWIAVVGMPIALLGLPFIMLAARVLLPERKPPDSGAVEGRSYIVEVVVEEKGPLVGRTIEGAGLRQLPGLYLSEIEREGNRLPAVGPDEVLHANDRLVFAGMVESVVDLLKIRGLVPATDQVSKVEADRANRRVVEAVVSHSSPLVRRTVRESRFRTVYNAAIIAVHRNGQRIRRKIGDIILQPGDTLLLSTHTGFTEAYRNSDHFYLVSNVDEAVDTRHERAWIAIAIMALLVILLAIPLGPVFTALNQKFGTTLPESGLHPLAAGLLCATLMVYTRCTTGTAARNA